MSIAILILVISVLIGLGVYFFPVPKVSFARIYASVPEETRRSLKKFRNQQDLRQLRVNTENWQYVAAGDAATTILFLHGMGGGYDIWWQQIDALRDRYRLIAPTYPAVHSLAELTRGVRAILERERVDRFHVVGSSLGGYLAQYLISKQPARIKKAVFANTFPPNDVIIQKSGVAGKLLPVLPEWMVMRNLRKTTAGSIYPASGYSELVAAYMLEQSYGMMRKAQFVARFHCVLDTFVAPDVKALGIKTLIIESDNDPLVEEKLRIMLKAAYPSAAIKTFKDAGHFPYLNRADEYTKILGEFFYGT